MAIALARIAYTQYMRRHEDPGALPMASNSIMTKSHQTPDRGGNHNGNKRGYTWNEEEIHDDQSLIFTLKQAQSVAIFPQYLSTESTVLIIQEVSLPKLSSSFSVTLPNGQEIFQIVRERPSTHCKQRIIDAKTQEPILTISKNRGTLPVSYEFTDSEGAMILKLEGEFFIPTQGARAKARFTNAMDKTEKKLSMQGSWHNRHAIIKDTGTDKALATMKSSIINLRTAIGGRRTFEVTVSAGVDIALITGMIVALDARSS